MLSGLQLEKCEANLACARRFVEQIQGALSDGWNRLGFSLPGLYDTDVLRWW